MVQASDVFLTDIRSSDMNGVDFDVHIQLSSAGTIMVLNQQALLQAVMVNDGNGGGEGGRNWEGGREA